MAWSRLVCLVVFFWSVTALMAQPLPLAGQWAFQLDAQDQGIRDRWFAASLPGRIRLPGSLPEQGIGDPVSVATPWTGQIIDRAWFESPAYAPYRAPGNVKVPYWLQPETYYKGPAWYQREIRVPADWHERRIVLFLERPHGETRAWLGDRSLGANTGLNTPHEYDLGPLPAGTHTLTLRVDNRMVVDIGQNSHAISDHTQGNWNGIVGRIELRTTRPVWIDDLQVYPRRANRSIAVRGRIGNITGSAGAGKLRLAVNSLSRTVDVQWDASGGAFDAELDLGPDARQWDEFSPILYKLQATLDGNDAVTTTFGLRETSTQGTQFVINGRKTFLRGTLECCIFPRTGHPPTDVAEWKRIIAVAPSYGLNLIRFHSYCPPEAAFVAADEAGMYLQVETCWPNDSTTLGDGKPVDAWVLAETDRILKYHGNHPSFVLMAHGNEPGGKNFKPYLARYVDHYKALDPRRLWTSGAGHPELPDNQFHITPTPRVQRWGEGLRSRINARPPETRTDYRSFVQARSVPVVSHEIGQWCAYPNFDEIPKYTGYLKPKNFEVFRDSLAARHMGDQARAFLMASGKLQTLCYKEDIESALRTPGMGGFELLDLHDFPGQGTALVGVLDPFWEEKGYVTADEYRRFCGPTVPLARLAKRVFTTDEKLDADVEAAHFGSADLDSAAASWKLVADDGAVRSGSFPARTIPIGNGISLGKLSVDLSDLAAPARYKLVVALTSPAGRSFENDWDVWIYPPTVDDAVPPAVTVARTPDQARAALAAGGRVLLLIPPAKVRNDADAPVRLGLSSIFWNTAWTRRQPPTTLGILCDPHHPMFAHFPTDAHSNWQWWYPVHRAAPMILDDLPPDLRPTLQVIDDWVTNHRLALAFEARIGPGKLLVCSIDLDAPPDPVTRQLRTSLLQYLAGGDFDPKTELAADQLTRLFAP